MSSAAAARCGPRPTKGTRHDAHFCEPCGPPAQRRSLLPSSTGVTAMQRNNWTNAVLGALLGGAAAMVLPEGGSASTAVVLASALIAGAVLVGFGRLDRRLVRAGDDPRSAGAGRTRLGLAGAFVLRLLTMLPGTFLVAVSFALLGAFEELCGEMGDDEVRRRRIVAVDETARTSRRSDTPWRRLPPSSLFVRPIRSTIP